MIKAICENKFHVSIIRYQKLQSFIDKIPFTNLKGNVETY